MPATITAIINQKGGTGKTCTCASLGIGLAREGKNVLLVDFAPQSSLTISLGYDKPDDLPVTVATLMMKAMNLLPKYNAFNSDIGSSLQSFRYVYGSILFH